MSDVTDKVFQDFGDHFFATRGRPSKEAVEDLHLAMDAVVYGRLHEAGKCRPDCLECKKEHDPYDCPDEDCELCKRFRREGDG